MAQVDTNTQNPNDPNNPNNPNPATPNQPAGQQTNQPATSGGAGAVTSTGAGNVTGQVVGTNNPAQPFQNIASYLSANAPQSATLANQVASSVSQPITQANQDITNASGAFGSSVNAGYTPENASLISQVASNPVAAAADPNNVAAFQAQMNDTYTGPTDFTSTPNYANLETEIANAQNLGSQAQTPTGVQTLLQGVEGPTTAGINNLDALLLNQNPANATTIANAGSAANNTNNNLLNFLTSQATTNNSAAQTAEQQAAAASGAAGTALNTAANNVVQPAQATLASDLTGTENYNAQLSSLINAIGSGNLGNLTQAQQADIGLNPQILTALSEYANIFPAVAQNNTPNPSIYYSGPNAAVLPSSISQVETPEQAAAVAALQELNGGAPLSALGGLSSTAPTTPYTVPTDLGKYNNTGLADFLYSAYLPTYEQYQTIPSGTQTIGAPSSQVNSYMALLAQLANQSLPGPQPNPPGGGGGLGGSGWGGV